MNILQDIDSVSEWTAICIDTSLSDFPALSVVVYVVKSIAAVYTPK